MNDNNPLIYIKYYNNRLYAHDSPVFPIAFEAREYVDDEPVANEVWSEK